MVEFVLKPLCTENEIKGREVSNADLTATTTYTNVFLHS